MGGERAERASRTTRESKSHLHGRPSILFFFFFFFFLSSLFESTKV